MYKLPVFETIRDTYQFIAAQRSSLVDYTIVPVIFGSLFATLFFISLFSGFTETTETINIYGVQLDPDQIAKLPPLTNFLPTGMIFFLSLVAAAANVALYILFSVAWHRRYLLGPTATSAREIFSWKSRHWRFLGRLILFLLILLLAALIIAIPVFLILSPILRSIGTGPANPSALILPALVVNIILSVPLALLASKLVLVLPAAATDQTDFRFVESTNLTHGNLWRIVLVFFIGLYLPYSISSWGISLLIVAPSTFELWIGSIGLVFVVMLVQQIIVYAGIAVGVSALSIIYRKLVDNVPIPSTPANTGAT